MYRLKSRKVPLGGWLILAAFVLLLSILQLVSNSTLLSQGVTTQAVVLSEGPDFCGRASSSQLATGGVEILLSAVQRPVRPGAYRQHQPV